MDGQKPEPCAICGRTAGSPVVDNRIVADIVGFRESDDALLILGATNLEDAVKVIPSSVTPAMIRQYGNFNLQRFGT